MDPAEQTLISIAEARALVVGAVRPLPTEPVAVADALGRSLAEDLAAASDIPAFANSAMDGFAITAGPSGRRLRIVGESRAGAPFGGHPGADEAVRISTGAAVPQGADAIAPLESCQEADGWVTVNDDSPPGRNVRGPGEDLRAGQPVLERGRRLGPAELALAVAAGRAELVCAVRPRVAVVTSGDELRAPGAPLSPGEIHDTNHVALSALARQRGAEVVLASPGGVGDDRAATEAALGAALEQADVLVVTGGVSVGPHDHVKDALRALGVEQRFWRVALRPGKPTWFGVRDGRLVFGLPGNPVSAMVTFLLFVGPALRALSGVSDATPTVTATLGSDLARHPTRDQAVRVTLSDGPGGRVAEVTGAQGSHRLSSMLDAEGLLIVERGEDELAAGTRVNVERVR